MPNAYYPPSAFSFQISIATPGLSPGDSFDVIFEEVSGIGAEMEIEEAGEGGDNRYVHRLPTPSIHPNLVLKKGLAKASSPLYAWVAKAFNESLAASPDMRTLLVTLVDESAQPLVSWTLHNAWPVSWKLSSSNTTGHDIVIESLECAYSFQERSVPGA